MRIIVVEDERTTRNGIVNLIGRIDGAYQVCLLYTSPSPRDA